jgi:acyl dehydratase
MTTPDHERLIAVGQKIERVQRFSRDDIAAFARLSHDENPLHVDRQAAQRARFGEIIASGQHTASIMMGILATHFSRSGDGVQREMLCLNMNFAFKQPVFADQDIRLQWRVSAVEWKSRLNGVLAQLDGSAAVASGHPAVVARGSILVKEVLA